MKKVLLSLAIVMASWSSYASEEPLTKILASKIPSFLLNETDHPYHQTVKAMLEAASLAGIKPDAVLFFTPEDIKADELTQGSEKLLFLRWWSDTEKSYKYFSAAVR